MFINQVSTVMGPAVQYGQSPLVITQMGNYLEVQTLTFQEEYQVPHVWSSLLKKAPSVGMTLEELGLTTEAEPQQVLLALVNALG
jgi:hypothetical protein